MLRAPAQAVPSAQNALRSLSLALLFLESVLCVQLMEHQMALGGYTEFLFDANIYYLRPESL